MGFGNLGLASGASILEAGCGTGVALPEILGIIGKEGRVVGIYATNAFIDHARGRAEQMGTSNARYEVGDIRAIPATDGAFDAVFCDKVLIHAGPPSAALAEMSRVTRGRWSAMSTPDRSLLRRKASTPTPSGAPSSSANCRCSPTLA